MCLRPHRAGSTIPRLRPTGSSLGIAPVDYDPVVLHKPFGPRLAAGAPPSRASSMVAPVRPTRAPPFPVVPPEPLHTFHPLWPVRRYPHLRISVRGPGPSGTSTHLTRQLPGTHARLFGHPAAERPRIFEQAHRIEDPSGRTTADLHGSAEPSDLSSQLSAVLDATMDAQRADFGNIQLYDDKTGTLAIVAHRGFSQAFLDYFATVDARDTSACGQALRSSARIIIEDITTEPSYAPHRAIAAAAGYRAVQSTPLLDSRTSAPVGMLSTHFRDRHRPSDRDLALTDRYAQQALR